MALIGNTEDTNFFANSYKHTNNKLVRINRRTFKIFGKKD